MDGVPDPCIAGIAICLPHKDAEKMFRRSASGNILIQQVLATVWSLHQPHGPSVCPDPLPPSELQARPQWFHRGLLRSLAGSGELARVSDESAETLRVNVTSPGGTTAAALEVLMEEEGLGRLMDRAVDAATKRSRELAG